MILLKFEEIKFYVRMPVGGLFGKHIYTASDIVWKFSCEAMTYVYFNDRRFYDIQLIIQIRLLIIIVLCVLSECFRRWAHTSSPHLSLHHPSTYCFLSIIIFILSAIFPSVYHSPHINHQCELYLFHALAY